MTRLLRTALILALAPAAVRAQPMDTTVALLGGWRFDTEAGAFERNDILVVRRGKLLRVGAPVSARDTAGARRIQLPDDRYILPGFFDLHAHYSVVIDDRGRREDTEVNPVVFLANGVTSTFPGGEYHPERMEALERRIDTGHIPGPRLFRSGPYFGSTRPGWDPDMTAGQIAREVDAWAARGVAGFKAKGIAPEHLRPLIDRAHVHGLTVTGHVDSGFRNSVNARDAILMGIDRIEHILGGDALDPEGPAYPAWVKVDTGSPEFRDIVRLFLDHGVYFDATINAPVYLSTPKEGFDDWVDELAFFTPEIRAAMEARGPRESNALMDSLYWTMRRTTKAFFDAGGGDLITLGTDLPSRGRYLAGFGAHREMHTMVLAGIPEAAVLRIATINGARALGVSDRLGSIETGKWADLVVVEGDPTADITNTRNVRMVMKAGRIHDPAALLDSVRGKLGPPPVDDVVTHN